MRTQDQVTYLVKKMTNSENLGCAMTAIIQSSDTEVEGEVTKVEFENQTKM